MLGLKQFGTPQFYVPQLPQTERPLHKAKDFMSFLNSLQWKADDETEDTPDVKTDVDDKSDNRRGADAVMYGLDPSLNSGHDTAQRVGSTRWDNMDDSQLWEQAMNSIATEEDPITLGYGDKIGMTPDDVYYRPERVKVPGIDPKLMTRVGF